jgi:Spy/CpxP family protein refolding chaperone
MRKHLAIVLASLVLQWAVLCDGTRAQGFALAPSEHETLLITDTELAAFNRILSTTREQQEAVTSLVQASRAEVHESAGRVARALKEFHDLPADRRTPEARQEMLAKARASAPDSAALRKRLLSDSRALLSKDQDGRWERFEYFLRRERVLHSDSGWGRDRTNLLALADAAGVKPQPGTPIAELLDQYERDLDRTLAELEGAEVDLNKSIAEARAKGRDFDSLRDKHPFWDIACRLREFNRRSASRLASELPSDQATALRNLYDQVSLPEAFSLEEGDESIRAAPGVAGLSDDARASLRKTVSSYSADRLRLTDAIAAIERAMRDAGPGDKVDSSNWDKLRLERGHLTAETQKKVRALLTPEQFQAALDAGHRKVEEWRWKWSR